MPYVRSNGISLYYERYGRGRPVVLMLAARIPHAEVYLFQDTGHLLLWERAEEVNDRIIEFLSRQGGGRNVSEDALSSTNKEGTR